MVSARLRRTGISKRDAGDGDLRPDAADAHGERRGVFRRPPFVRCRPDRSIAHTLTVIMEPTTWHLVRVEERRRAATVHSGCKTKVADEAPSPAAIGRCATHAPALLPTLATISSWISWAQREETDESVLSKSSQRP